MSAVYLHQSRHMQYFCLLVMTTRLHVSYRLEISHTARLVSTYIISHFQACTSHSSCETVRAIKITTIKELSNIWQSVSWSFLGVRGWVPGVSPGYTGTVSRKFRDSFAWLRFARMAPGMALRWQEGKPGGSKSKWAVQNFDPRTTLFTSFGK